MTLPIPPEALEGATIEHDADCGYAARRNGIILLRTATDSDWQAMGNGLVLIFGADPQMIDWAYPRAIRAAWDKCVAASSEEIEIVACRVVLAEPLPGESA